MTSRLPDLRLILRAVAALALLAVFALAPASVSLSGVAHAQSADPEPTIVNICDRTEQVRDAILANLRDVSDCAAVTDSDLDRVTYLGLSGRQKTALQAGDFQGLANLERLYLDGNSLTELPDGVFHGLSNLEWLDLYGNSLTELPDGVFDGLSNLEYLYLDGNSLSELPDGVFNGLSNLEWLYLGSNDLTTLPDGVFDGLSNLEFLYLQSNDLTGLPDGVFGGLSSLGTLDLRENDLTGLPDGVFDSLDSLEFLYLQSNDLTGLPDGVFDELTNLESLEFSYNDLTQLRADVFNGLSKLESLEFSYNDLTALPADVFGGLSSLENLDLNLNYLSKLPDGVFDGLSSLEDLSLGGNYLTTLPADVFNGLSNLEYLSLSANDLTALPAGVFKGPSNLEYLSLSANDLTALPAGVFKGLSNLEYLSLSANDLTELPAGVFKGLANLEWLLLNGNDLTELPAGVFDGLSSLRSVDLEDNPGAPFTLTVELEQRGDDAFVVKVAHGTPSDMTVTLAAEGGTLSDTTVTIDGGSVTSEEISVTPDDTGQVTIGFESVATKGAVVSDLDETELIVSQMSRIYKGIHIGFGEPLVLGDAESVNTPATGAPTISGTAQVGETLTASISGIEDADGLTGVTFSYQWLSSRDTEIQGATSANYTLVAADAGKTIKVRVSFTDDRGFDESLTSAPTEVVTARPTGICDRTPQVRHAILAKLPDVSDCAAVTDSDLNRVTYLNLSGRQTTELQAGDFQGLVNLERLDLYNNRLSELPDGVFDSLSNLEYLYLGSNDLTTLPDGVFNGVPKLEWLYLGGNDLTTLPDGVFDGLSMSTLSLMNNQLTTLPAPLFSSMDWPNNRCFVGLCLLIRGNQIAELPDGLFHIEDFDAVMIHMQDNPGTPFTFSMEAEVIDQTTDGDGLATARVRWKVAQGAPLTMRASLSVTGGTASDSSVAIRSGSIYSNEITVAQTEVGQTATLTLGEVSAHRLRGGRVLIAPHYEYSLGRRYYYGFQFAAGAPLTLFDSPTPTPTQSAGICDRTQQVQDAIIAKLNEGLDTPEVTDCAEVTAEDLSGITGAMELSIEEIPALKSGDFEGLSNLNSLQMIDSGLETLPEDIFDGLTALHSLFIIGNDDLETLPEDIFDGLTGLTNLHVSGNEGLGELPEGIFDGLTSLAFLHLAENSLTELPEDIFDGLTGLQLLHLQNNQLTGLPSGIFDGLGSLKYILLNGNSLRALPADVFEGLSSLTQLPLEGNRLESLPDGLFEGLVSLEQVLLSGNPGAPFALTAELEQRGDGAFVVKVVEGSPFDLTVTLSARGGTLSSTTVTVEGGSLASKPVSVKAAGNVPARVTVTVDSATFPEDREYFGINTGLGQPLVLDVPGNPPAETVQLTVPASVPRNTEATVTMSFGGLESDSDTSDTDYIFRADVKDAENRDADACEGGGMGNDRYMYKVDEDPEVRAATISAACPPGDYTIEVSISSPGNVDLASAAAGFTVPSPAEQRQAQEPPPSTDATLSGLTLSGVDFGTFDSATTGYTASVANDVTQTTATPTVKDDGASYVVKLGDAVDGDGTVELSVGSNTITVEVTAEDGKTTKTYTVTVTRAAPSASGPAVTLELSPSGSVAEGTEITVTMTFGGLESDSDTSTTDYIFRADVSERRRLRGRRHGQ